MADVKILELSDSMFAQLDGQKTKKAREKKAAAFVAVFEYGTVLSVLEQYAARIAANAAKVAVETFKADVEKKELTKPLLALFVRATALGLTLGVKATASDEETGEPTKATLYVVEKTSTGGKKGGRWSYKLDGKPLLKTEGGQFSSVKNALDFMAAKGNTNATKALKNLELSKDENDTTFRWKLNGWTAAQSIPALASRFTRSR